MSVIHDIVIPGVNAWVLQPCGYKILQGVGIAFSVREFYRVLRRRPPLRDARDTVARCVQSYQDEQANLNARAEAIMVADERALLYKALPRGLRDLVSAERESRRCWTLYVPGYQPVKAAYRLMDSDSSGTCGKWWHYDGKLADIRAVLVATAKEPEPVASIITTNVAAGFVPLWTHPSIQLPQGCEVLSRHATGEPSQVSYKCRTISIEDRQLTHNPEARWGPAVGGKALNWLSSSSLDAAVAGACEYIDRLPAVTGTPVRDKHYADALAYAVTAAAPHPISECNTADWINQHLCTGHGCERCKGSRVVCGGTCVIPCPDCTGDRSEEAPHA